MVYMNRIISTISIEEKNEHRVRRFNVHGVRQNKHAFSMVGREEREE